MVLHASLWAGGDYKMVSACIIGSGGYIWLHLNAKIERRRKDSSAAVERKLGCLNAQLPQGCSTMLNTVGRTTFMIAKNVSWRKLLATRQYHVKIREIDCPLWLNQPYHTVSMVQNVAIPKPKSSKVHGYHSRFAGFSLPTLHHTCQVTVLSQILAAKRTLKLCMFPVGLVADLWWIDWHAATYSEHGGAAAISA